MKTETEIRSEPRRMIFGKPLGIWKATTHGCLTYKEVIRVLTESGGLQPDESIFVASQLGFFE